MDVTDLVVLDFQTRIAALQVKSAPSRTFAQEGAPFWQSGPIARAERLGNMRGKRIDHAGSGRVIVHGRPRIRDERSK